MAFKGNLIISGMNAKTIKGDKASNYETAIMYLAPYTASGHNVCAMAETAKCHVGCLYTAGRGAMNNVQQARHRKTALFNTDRKAFLVMLDQDIEAFKAYCKRKGALPAVRLNGTSDIMWEVIARDIITKHHDVQFYDYTKIAKRVRSKMPANYALTLSYSASNVAYSRDILATADAVEGANVAVVFRDKETRSRYMETGFHGRPVIDGDETDLRFLDPKGVIVGLYAKGKAKGDHSGFVVD